MFSDLCKLPGRIPKEHTAASSGGGEGELVKTQIPGPRPQESEATGLAYLTSPRRCPCDWSSNDTARLQQRTAASFVWARLRKPACQNIPPSIYRHGLYFSHSKSVWVEIYIFEKNVVPQIYFLLSSAWLFFGGVLPPGQSLLGTSCVRQLMWIEGRDLDVGIRGLYKCVIIIPRSRIIITISRRDSLRTRSFFIYSPQINSLHFLQQTTK